VIKTIVRRFILYCGPWCLLRFIRRKLEGGGISILYGHRVLPDDVMNNKNDPRYITGQSSVSDLDNAIIELKKRFSIIHMDEAIQRLKKKDYNNESVVLTFDDGFNDNFTYLLPLLKKHDVPATYYVNPSVIGSERSLWFQAIINYFYSIQETHVFITLSNKKYDLSSPKKRYSAAFDFMQCLQKNYPPSEFNSIIKQIAGVKSHPKPSDFHLNWNELLQLSKEPLITLGAHSYSHYPLRYCDEQLAKNEIERSIVELNTRLNYKIKHFSYPRGHKNDFNLQHIQILKKLGIISAVTTIRGVNRQGQDLYRIKRIGLPQNTRHDIEEFLWHVGGLPQIIKNIRRSK
jgi:peptidoglycan/xylan/chitin deacetylase (PgdA/CDA1 family)